MSYLADSADTMRVKHYALSVLNADLVGVANIERFADAPLRMSPHGIMPDARSVIVMAVHHPDAAMERGGLNHPQEIGPYCIQYHMNNRLDDMSYRMGIFLENMGFRAVPVVSSNIWRYRGYKDLTAQFAPDTSHMHAAVACGLAEFGYNGLAITPEFGAHQRYVTIITDAVLTPTPLLEPGSVCDRCMICKRECRSGALSKEIDGWNEVHIEDKVYRYARKNLWRCAWGEHFDLDLDLPIPEHVDEKVIMDATIRYGRRGGEMGSCQRYCLPRELRYWDKAYTNAPRRKRQFIPNPEVSRFHRGVFEAVRARGAAWGADHVVVTGAETLKNKCGIDIASLLPGAVCAVSMVSVRDPETDHGEKNVVNCHQLTDLWTPVMVQAGYDAVRELERHGYSAAQFLEFPENDFVKFLHAAPGKEVRSMTLLTDAPLPETGFDLPPPQRKTADKAAFTRLLRNRMRDMECDLFGVAPAERINAFAPELRKIYDGEVEFIARNKADTIYKPYDPEMTENVRKVAVPEDHLAGARSVIVLGLRLPSATVDITARTPAEAAGPYVFAQYESINRLRILAWNLLGELQAAGYRGVVTSDLNRTGSFCWNPRGEYPDAFSNVFAAAAAGLGRISRCGTLITPEFGANIRTISIVTDAELEADDVLAGSVAECAACTRGVNACETAAFGAELRSVTIGGVKSGFRKVDVNRCSWAKRWSLVADEGNRYTGWHLDEKCPDKVTPEAIAEAIRTVPQIEKIRPCNFEQCVLACPFSRKQEEPISKVNGGRI